MRLDFFDFLIILKGFITFKDLLLLHYEILLFYDMWSSSLLACCLFLGRYVPKLSKATILTFII